MCPLQEVSPRGLRAVFERFRGILHDGAIDKRVQYTIESLFAVRKSGFADYPAVPESLDLVEKVGPLIKSSSQSSSKASFPIVTSLCARLHLLITCAVLWSGIYLQGDKITFEMTLEDAIDKEEMLDVFRVDPDYEANENAWKEIKKVTGMIYVDHNEKEELVRAKHLRGLPEHREGEMMLVGCAESMPELEGVADATLLWWPCGVQEILGESESDEDADDEDDEDEDEDDDEENGQMQAQQGGQLAVRTQPPLTPHQAASIPCPPLSCLPLPLPQPSPFPLFASCYEQVVHDMTEQDLVNLKRTIYLTIMASAGFEECTHRLMKLKIPQGLEIELCNMLVECCSQVRPSDSPTPPTRTDYPHTQTARSSSA